jgi:type I restriction enzyme S subunit
MTALVTEKLPLVAGAPNGVPKLRELVLELAVRGMLSVRQDSDEPANQLVERIRVEKIRLVSSGALRKLREPTKIESKHFPHALPPSWTWARWDTLALKIGDIDHKMPETTSDGVPFVSPRDFFPGNIIDFDRAKRVSIDDFERLSAKIKAERGDLIYPRYGTIGENVFVNVDRDFLVSYSCAVVKVMHGYMDPLYQYYFSLSGCTKIQAKAAENKTTQANVGIKSIQDYLVPVPPLAEQHRIVAKVDELMALCDRLEAQQADAEAAHAQLVKALLASLTQARDAADFRASWQQLSAHFHTLFTTESSIDALKQTVLQLGVMGKLSSQDPSEAPATSLLQEVAAARSSPRGRSHQLAPLSPKSMQPGRLVPRGWVLTTLGEVIDLISGQHLGPEEYALSVQPDGIPYLTGPAEFGPVHPRPTRFTRERRAIAMEGDLLLTVKGSGVGSTNVVDIPELAISRQLMAVRPIKVNRKFILLTLKALHSHFQASSIGIAIPGIGRADVINATILLPPLAEQHRIVAKVDELLALCDQLKLGLAQARQHHAHLAAVLVEQAVAT